MMVNESCRRQKINILFSIMGVLFAVSPLINELWSANEQLALAALWLLMTKLLVDKVGSKVLCIVIILVLATHAQWGVAQFIMQRDLGLYLLGETRISVEDSGVAKFAIGSEKLVRAYGPYPHANSLGGGLSFGLLLVAVWMTKEKKVSMLHNSFLWPILGSLLLGIMVSFSRTAYLSSGFILLILACYLSWPRQWLAWKCFGLLILLGLIFMPLLIARLNDIDDRAFYERIVGSGWSIALIAKQQWWQGVGWGKYPEKLKVYLDEQGITYKPWQIDYVHSVPLLVTAELGVASTLLLTAAAGSLLLIFYRNEWWWLLGVTPLVLFDHYMVTQLTPMLLLLTTLIVILHRMPNRVVH